MICPICGSSFEKSSHSYICKAYGGKRHCFDISSSGYSDLSYRSGGSGDPKDAVKDRTLFLDRGHYFPLSCEINRICSENLVPEFLLIDAGCGEGYYSENIASAFDNAYVFGVDLSKHAVHHASVRRNIRKGCNSFYAVSSIFSLPVADNSADCVLSMFAPIAEEEFLRVLKPGGILIIGAAGRNHLYDLKKAIYDDVHLNDERADLPKSMIPVCNTSINYRMLLDNSEDIMRLFGMTPYKFRTSESSYDKLRLLTRLDTEAEVNFHVYKKQ